MNRDREALSQKLIDTRNRYLIAQPDKPDSAWAVLTECAEALALPVGGGVEEQVLREQFGKIVSDAMDEANKVPLAQVGHFVDRLMSALSPTTPQGEES